MRPAIKALRRDQGAEPHSSCCQSITEERWGQVAMQRFGDLQGGRYAAVPDVVCLQLKDYGLGITVAHGSGQNWMSGCVGTTGGGPHRPLLAF